MNGEPLNTGFRGGMFLNNKVRFYDWASKSHWADINSENCLADHTEIICKDYLPVFLANPESNIHRFPVFVSLYDDVYLSQPS